MPPSPRRVLLLITDLEIGGTPTVVRELAVRLWDDRTRVQVACIARWGPVADQLAAAGIVVTALNAGGAVQLFSVVRRLLKLIRQEQFDTVFSFLIHANTVAAITSYFCSGVRFLQSIQTTQPTPRWHWWLQSIVQRAAERIVVPSPSTASVASDWAHVPAEKIAIIANAVSTTVGPSVSSTVEQTAREKQPTIGFLGRLDPIKRVPDLVEAMSLLPASYKLSIFGEGADRPRIESTIGRLSLSGRITLHGAIANPSRAFAEIDVLVLPSQAEGFGLVLIEAMAAGIPVVATNVPGIRDVVRNNQTGLLVPVSSPGELARAIERVTTDGPLRQRLTAAASEQVRGQYSWDTILPQYRQVLAR